MLIAGKYITEMGQTTFTVGGNLSTMMERERAIEGRVFLVVEEVVAGLYPEVRLSRPVETLVLPSLGEGLKTMGVLCHIVQWLHRHHVRRDDRVLLAGGGALLDVGSLAASLFKRGLSTVLVPSTVLAQVDAAIGGKCGVNFDGVKNIMGHFHFPVRVYCAPEVVSTLSTRHFCSGLAEVWKYCLLQGLDRLPSGAYRFQSNQFADLVARCIQYKTKLVEQDPWDTGQRRWLNLGHTLAHALEAVDTNMFHGEAVIWGLEFALRVAMKRGLFPRCRGMKIIAALRKHPRPPLPHGGFLPVWQAMNADKKKNAHGVNMVLLTETGPLVAPCNFAQLLSAWNEL